MLQNTISDQERRDTDHVGLLLIGASALFSLYYLFSGNLYLLPPAVLGFLILNFGGHAAIHRSLFSSNSKSSRAMNELILLVCYTLHFSSYHHIVVGHLRHHKNGRTDEYGEVDVVENAPTAYQRIRYYAFLTLIPFSYWTFMGFCGVIRHPLKRDYSVNGRHLHLVFPFFVSFLPAAIIITGCLYYHPFALLYYYLPCCVLWNLLQNVAHYGLTANGDEMLALASRTYVVGPMARRLTFGSLAHLPHHFDMNLPGSALHEVGVLQRINSELRIDPIITHGMVKYLKDVMRQFKGPVERKELSAEWFRVIT